MSKPPIVRFSDAAIYGTAGLLGLLAAYYVQGHAEPGTQTQAYVLMWVVGGLFAISWPVRMLMRWSFNRRISFVTKHRVAVILNGYQTTLGACEKVIDDMLQKWPVIAKPKHSPGKALEALSKDYTYVSFKAGSDLSQYIGGTTGRTVGRTCTIAFAEKDIPMEQTAFAHEVGHVTYAIITGDWGSNKEFHEFSAEHALGV